MRKFSIAGLQLNLDYSNNRELVTTKIKNVVRRYPWINMVVVSELAVGGSSRSEEFSLENNIQLSDDLFYGSTAIALSYDEPVVAAKIIKGFLKEHELPTVKGIMFEGSYIDSGQFDKIASLPSKDESLTVLAIMLKSPIKNFANLLSAPMVNVVNVLKGVEKNKSVEN